MELETFVEGNQIVTRAKCMTPHTVGSVERGSTALTVRDPSGFADGNTILVAGAGPEGGDLVSTITVAGNTFTLAQAASETARRADGTPTPYANGATEVTNPSTGVWELRLVNDENDWAIHFQGTTPCHCAGEAFYRVKRARALA